MNWIYASPPSITDKSPNEIQPVLYPTHQIRPPRDHKMTRAYVPFIQNSLKWISSMLSNYNIKTVSLPPRKILSSSIHSIPCVCHKVYIGQRGSSIKTRIKERKELTTTIREVSSGKHNNDLSYRILFDNTGILAGKHWCMELLIREPADIELNPNNVNWEDGFSLHIPLKPFISTP